MPGNHPIRISQTAQPVVRTARDTVAPSRLNPIRDDKARQAHEMRESSSRLGMVTGN